MIKHAIEHHEDSPLNPERFCVKVLKYTRTAFERQILESVIIQEENKGHFILNSKSEYNRCAIPRLAAKLGEKLVGENSREEKKKEDLLDEKIRKWRKEENSRRRKKEKEQEEEKVKAKRRKLGIGLSYWETRAYHTKSIFYI